ncbi:dual specificity protein phosphatase family protein [Paenibacillus pinihumi]|uniref:dual specificity protein phosphatase family protein n=1 Tax=Paenibacillus pinihumi TaxID=669462 RepID=UPI0003FBBBF3|nr:dual specificity protein phosphatase family protein [Paenibacillus pinihumi]
MPKVKTAWSSCRQLVEGKVWIGGLGDMTTLIEKEHCQIIVDLRAEKVLTGKEHPLHYIQIPIASDTENQQSHIHQAVEWVSEMAEAGYRLGLHCSEDRTRTACIAIGVLIRLGCVATIHEAQNKLNHLWPDCGTDAKLSASLHDLYP